MNPVRTLRQKASLSQSAMALAAGTSQPTIAAYEAGTKSPTLATLGRLASSLGLEATVVFYPPFTREERRSLFLHNQLARRVAEDSRRVLAIARRNLTYMSRTHPDVRLFREWKVVLELPLTELCALMLDPSPWARELRHVTPFAGVLTARERTAAYRAFAESEANEL